MSGEQRATPGCLSAETLAAFVDGRMDASARAEAERHLAECRDCYEAMVDTVQTVRELDAGTGQTQPTPWRSRTTLVMVGTLAAAVALVLWLNPALLRRQTQVESAMGDLVRAVGTGRLAEGRLSAPFEWGEVPSAVRGSGPSEVPTRVKQASVALQALADEQKTAATLHGAALGFLAEGNIERASALLEESISLAPGEGRTRVDFSAVLLERWRRTQITEDAARALDEAERAVQALPISAEAKFNRALALEAIGLVEAAARAWEEYLQHDASSRWAAEAREHLGRLKSRSPAPTGDLDLSTGESARQLALNSPLRLYRFLSGDVLEPWAEQVAAGRSHSVDFARGRMAAAVLREANRDRYLPDLIDLAGAAAAWPEARQRCFADALLAMRASRSESDNSNYERGRELAQAAEGAFACAGATTIGARMQQAWNLFFADRRRDMMPLVQTLSVEADRLGYLGVGARAAYLQGLFSGGSGEFTDGLHHYDRALRLYRQAGDTGQVAATELQIAAAYDLCGDTESAWRHYAEAFSLLHLIDRPRLRYMVLSYPQLTALDNGYLYAASVLSRELEPVVDGWRIPFVTADAATDQADLWARLGRAEDAQRALTRARAQLPAIPEGPTRAQYEAAVAWTEARLLQASNPDAAIAALDPVFERMQRANLPQGLARVHLVRGRAHAAARRPIEAKADWVKGAEALENLRPHIRDEQLQIGRTSELWDLYAELIGATLGDQPPDISLAFAERARARTLLDVRTRRFSAPAAGPALYDWLPDGVTVLAYTTLPEKLVVWTVRRRGVTVATRDVTADRLAALVNSYSSALRSRSPSAGFDGTLAALLIPDDVVRGPSDVLAIVPDGALHELPFPVLFNARTRRFLVEDAVLVIAPSLALLKASLSAGPPRLEKALVAGYGSAQPAFGLAILPQVPVEVAAVARIHPRARVLEGARATKAEVLTALSGAGVVHFAGHALADDRRPEAARLFLAPAAATGESALMPPDLANVRLAPGAVVVLSACSAARGRAFRGEGALSLARPFLAAGASAVMASLWDVEDASVTALVTDIHARVANGTSLHVALSEAQRASLRAQQSIGRWGGWIVMGMTAGGGRNEL